jgi:hypothetical protein
MLADRPETDAVDLEEVLIQVMNDEFDVAVDDESAPAFRLSSGRPSLTARLVRAPANC